MNIINLLTSLLTDKAPIYNSNNQLQLTELLRHNEFYDIRQM